MVCANDTNTSYVEIVQVNPQSYPVTFTNIGTYEINLNSSNNVIASFPFKIFGRGSNNPNGLDAGTAVLKFSTAETRKNPTCGSQNLIVPRTLDSRDLTSSKKCVPVDLGELTLFLDIYPNPALVDSANRLPYMYWNNYWYAQIRDLPPLQFYLQEFATMVSRVYLGVGLWNSFLNIEESWMTRYLPFPVNPNSAFGQISALSPGQSRYVNYNWPLATAQSSNGGFNFSAPIPVSASNILNQPLATDWFVPNTIAGLPNLTRPGGIPMYPKTPGFGNAFFPGAPVFAGENTAVTPGELLNMVGIYPQVGVVRSGADFHFGTPKSTQLIPGRTKQFILKYSHTPSDPLAWANYLFGTVNFTIRTPPCL